MLPFALTASIFSFLSAAFHGLVLLNYDWYTYGLRRGYNLLRWWEYALSSSVMIALIVMLFGIYDMITLFAIMAVNASMNLFGLVFEVSNSYLREAGKTSKEDVDW